MKKLLCVLTIFANIFIFAACADYEPDEDDCGCNGYCETAIDELKYENEELMNRVEELEYVVEDLQNQIYYNHPEPDDFHQ